MAPRINLTPIDGDTVLQHGMPFVVKWNNPAAGRAADLWIGIHVPENVAFGVRKPKNNASSDVSDGSLKYVMYLPGRNVCRWIDIKSLYPLSAYPPDRYDQDGRDSADIYGRLYAMVQQTSNVRFWISFAKKERSSKDRSDKVPSIDFASTAAGAGGVQGSEADAELEDDDDDDEVASEFAGDIEGSASVYSAGGPQGQMEAAKRLRTGKASFTTNKKAKTGASVGQQQYHRHQQQQLPEPDGEEVVAIYIGNGNDQKVFHLSREKVSKSSLLKDCIQGKSPYIFHPHLHQMTPAEFEPIYAYLSHDDGLDSDLVSVYGNGGDNADEEEDMLGDVKKFGKSWMLKDVHSIEDLSALIPQLTATYAQAHSFGLTDMAGDVFMKIQVAWNVYGRVEQLPLFFDFVESIMPHLAQDPARGSASGAVHGQSSYGLGTTQQSWIVKFLAETMVLYTTGDPQRFWALLNKYRPLRAAVLKMRVVLDDDKLFCLEQKFMQQEPLTEASFVIPAKMEHSAEQEEAEKEEGMEQMAEASFVIPAKMEQTVEEGEAEKEDVMEQVAEANE